MTDIQALGDLTEEEFEKYKCAFNGILCLYIL